MLSETTDDDCLFAHIMDPVERRHRGVAEYIKRCGLIHQAISDHRLQNLLKFVPALDSYTVSYRDVFGDLVNKINWIPLHSDKKISIQRTENWLMGKGVSIDLQAKADANQWVREPDPMKERVVNLLRETWESVTIEYHKTIEKFQSDWEAHYKKVRGESWPVSPNYHDFSQLPANVREELYLRPVSGGSITSDLTMLVTPMEILASGNILLQETLKDDIQLWNKTLQQFGLTE